MTFLSCLLVATMAHAQVVINEFQPENISTVADPLTGEYSDWVELHNTGSADADISGYYLTDDKGDTTKWQIPAGTSITAGGYLVVWADGRNNGLNTNFKLDKTGDALALYSLAKVRLDLINFTEIPDGASLGRKDNGTVWVQYSAPTPGTANTTSSVKAAAPEALFSQKGGSYSAGFMLQLSSVVADAKIYYTIDGSVPTTSSARYTAPFTVAATAVVKAKVVHADYNDSRISTNTYFIGEHTSTFPVVSVGVDPFDFFDPTTGMYSPGPNPGTQIPYPNANYWQDRELPATFEYFVNGKQVVEVNAGIKIYGNWSRRFAQRSLAINCKSEYGDERMRYKFFPDKTNDVYKQVVLRNAGSDVNCVRYRDMMIHSLIKGRMDIDHQDGTPTIVYINGQYWGIMNLREKLQERFIQDNYGIDDKDVDVIANYEDRDGNGMPVSEFRDLQQYFENNSISNASNFAELGKMMDINEYMNYVIAEIFISNRDWPGYNIKYWKQKGVGHQWRWIFYDTDQSFGDYAACNQFVNTLADATAEGPDAAGWPNSWGWPNPEYSTLFLRKLLTNTTFKNEFIQRFAAHLNSTFSSSRVTGIISDFEKLYAPEKPYHLARWGSNDSAWNAQYDTMISFANQRPDLMRGFIKKKFSLSGLSDLTIKSVNCAHPEYSICQVALYGQDIKGQYYNSIPFAVKAVENGQKFLRWEDEAGNLLSADPSLSLTLTSAKTVVAVYGQKSIYDNIFINEFMAANTSGITDEAGEHEDWIEIYNGNDVAIELGGMYITDNLAQPKQYLIPVGKNGETSIPAKGYLILWADGQLSQGARHVEIKLSATGEQIGLSRMVGTEPVWVDSLSYGMMADNISAGRTVDGGTFAGALAAATPGASNGKATSEEPVRTFAVDIYPTEVRDVFYIVSDAGEQLHVELFRLSGNKVFTAQTGGEPVATVPVNGLASGMYIAKVQTSAGAHTFKISVR